MFSSDLVQSFLMQFAIHSEGRKLAFYSKSKFDGLTSAYVFVRTVSHALTNNGGLRADAEFLSLRWFPHYFDLVGLIKRQK